MILENDGIRLRAVEPEDLELLYRWENDEANWKLSNTLVPYSRYILKKYIAGSGKSIYETGQLRLMIEVLPDERTVGTIDLYDFDHFHNRAGVGILIADPADRKKGYASAALVCLIGYAFETIGLHQLWCNILENNAESLHLFTHHGFVICGARKEWVRMGTGYETEYNLQLISPKK
ncbi:MAG: GNAT family N-acetyltransferase [Bacteroidales bacterium]|jgi:diamine N-acetyltransferase|nr:GNAT family N-acetyltransferase [Bacteroidales bacterium]